MPPAGYLLVLFGLKAYLKRAFFSCEICFFCVLEYDGGVWSGSGPVEDSMRLSPQEGWTLQGD